MLTENDIFIFLNLPVTLSKYVMYIVSFRKVKHQIPPISEDSAQHSLS